MSLPVFQSTHPHGVRLAAIFSLTSRLSFQSTHPHGVRLLCQSKPSNAVCFNPRTHTGCDVVANTAINSSMVSIHAPTRGATGIACASHVKEFLFQSTHPHGVRHGILGSRGDCRLFQSTHPHGVRLQSIELVLSPMRFQSTHPHGVRPFTAQSRFFTFAFQSTHPHGVRHHLPLLPTALLCFNPRTHTGCDDIS